jgi:hypothetical protein
MPQPHSQPLSPAPGNFQGPDTSAGLPLAAPMGRLVDISPCPVGARQRLDANLYPCPEGAHRRLEASQTHGNLETRSWTLWFSFFGGHPSIRMRAAGLAMRHPAARIPPINSVSRQPEGSKYPSASVKSPYIIIPFSTRNLALPVLKNMSQPSYPNGLDCAPFFVPWAQSDCAFGFFMIKPFFRGAQFWRKAFMSCAGKRGAVHCDYGPSMHHQAIVKRVGHPSESCPRNGIQSHLLIPNLLYMG